MNITPNISITKSELISTLSDIDLKINNLHQRSSSDFMQLNDHLKDYHKKTKIISENAFRILETISGGKDMDLIKELGKIHSRIEEYRKNINKDDTRRLKILKESILRSNQLNIILRNLRQDFTTLKFLSTNYCLLSNYKDTDSKLNENIEYWNSEIQSIHKSLISVSGLVNSFREQVMSCIQNLEMKVERSLEIFQNLSRETIRNIDSVTLKSLESKLQFPVLKEKSIDSSKSISDIITHLQYHDIIRQKIEHIQKSHYTIIEDLNRASAKSGNDTDCSPEDYIKIGDIIDLQSAQLLLVSKEYQKALNVITRNFQGIAVDLSTISDISDKFSLENKDSEITLLRQIKDQLDKGVIQLDMNHSDENNSGIPEAGKMLGFILSRLENEIMPLLTEFTCSESMGIHKVKFSDAGSGVLSQIISLTRDIEIKNQDIGDKITEIGKLSEGIFHSDEPETWVNQLELDRLHLMVNISKILDSLDKDNEELDIVLNQNRDLNNNVLAKIESAINKADYCEYFENIVEQVINQLASINNRINPSGSKEIITDKAENLKAMQTSYTMESERIIHNSVVSGTNTEAEQTDSDNEIEFF